MAVHIDVTEIVRAVSNLLGKLAVKGKHEGEDENGVCVFRHDPDSPDYGFRFVTVDDIQVHVLVDMREVHKVGVGYMKAMMDDTLDAIAEKRRERQENGGFIIPVQSPISAAFEKAATHQQ